MNPDETIAALASAPGGAARGVVRVSGPNTAACLAVCFRGEEDLGQIRRPRTLAGQLELGAPLGEVPADLYFWPGPRSYTRQPLAELHLPGSPPVLHAAVRAVCAAGARLAAPGEFTLRAFLAGRLDLTQAEAVLAVIDADSRAELGVALRQLAGGLAGPLHEVRNRLLDLLAHVEAGLDFVEEAIEFISADELRDQLRGVAETLGRLIAQMAARGRDGEPFRVALVGRPNVGKSSLLNALTGERAALVSARAGTTRDYLTRTLEIDGLACRLIDTAGTDAAASEPVAIAAQSRAQQQAAQAHIQLLCLDATQPLEADERRLLAADATTNRIVVLTKIDLPRTVELEADAIGTSAHTGTGLAELRRAIFRCLTADRGGSEVVAGTADRCRESLHRAAKAVRRALHSLDDGDELVAVELRLALDELAQVVGAVYTDDILDRVFSRFCIGK